ncbi:glycosyltransferase family 4 protein [Deinococcus sp. RIT780]|uniref:glycosyltransferase family 4 protein n=1 Tax=Deinococcus sp. RIT780 TaxID=2870472 RepID=UPI001C89E945|nr:glycosyltransferase family 4 protein [Deinococcus sp. RIT780]MBX8463648.1 glycosyltransferase family 4 protein [Deinococcus sp. RIT780]
MNKPSERQPPAPRASVARSAPAALDGHLVMIGNYAPRQCGIATFTQDLVQAVGNWQVSVVAMNDAQVYDYPPEVVLGIEQDDLNAYVTAAAAINALKPDVVCVQHEYGIYGGPAGSYLLTLLRALDAPLVTTLHTVLEAPDDAQRAALEELCALSRTVVVMSERAVSILRAQGVPAGKLQLIPHGIPSFDLDSAEQKRLLGLGAGPLLLTFGLLGPGKGLESAIRALPDLLARQPDVTYLILGATHPHVRRGQGEQYRESLWTLARELGVQDAVRMENRFVSLPELMQYLAAADVYLSPYQNPAQITSGTLAYALGNGKAVISTPYWYAEELLADGRGVLTPFADPAAMARAAADLLADPARRAAMGRRAAQYGQDMKWPAVGAAYQWLFAVCSRQPAWTAGWRAEEAPGPVSLEHLEVMTDSTGLFQHATGVTPNPHEGYTTDDNARLLGLLCRLPPRVPALRLARRALAFLHYALEPGRGVFRNFLGYDRQWLEQVGSENAQARAVRALVAAATGPHAGLAASATELLDRAPEAAAHLRSPRPQAVALLAAAQVQGHPALHGPGRALLQAAAGYAANLTALHAASARPGWDWFEEYLSYANAELSHGLIAWGEATGDLACTELGVRTLEWLSGQQQGPPRPGGAAFWPVGCERVYWRGEARPLWDGQPIEAAVSAAAYVAAWHATGDPVWTVRAERALGWLLGDNLRGEALLDAAGGCRDGLHRQGVSLNQGAESTVLALEATLDVTLMQRALIPPLPAERTPVTAGRA